MRRRPYSSMVAGTTQGPMPIIPPDIEDEYLGVEAPDDSLYAPEPEGRFETSRFENFAERFAHGAAGLQAPPPRDFGEGLLQGLVGGFAAGGARIARARDRFEARREVRARAVDDARLRAGEAYRRERAEAKRTAAGRKEAETVIVDDRLVKQFPDLADWLGGPVPPRIFEAVTGKPREPKEKPKTPAELRGWDAGELFQLQTKIANDPEMKRFIDVRSGYQRVRAGEAAQTPQGDMAMIFGFMKMLDPGSTVREGEYATAENTRGVPATIRLQYNKLVDGFKLDPTQRTKFLQMAEDLYSEDVPHYERAIGQYRKVGSSLGLPEDLYLRDYSVPPPRAPRRNSGANKDERARRADEFLDSVLGGADSGRTSPRIDQ